MTQEQEREAFEAAALDDEFVARYDYAFQNGQPQATQAVPQDLESLAINRYRPVPAGVIAYKVVAGDGERSLFSGTKDECQIVARKLTEAFLDGAHAMLAAAPTAPAQRQPLTDEQIAVMAGGGA